jgi:pimeloyl-ACP methyl ester carboxylesterase
VPYARNALDGNQVYFEDDGGTGAPVVLHGGFLDSVATVRDLDLAHALRDEFRLIYVDHRGLGRSDKPHDPDAYAMPLRVADAVAVLDELGIERVPFIGMSWGGRLGFGIGEHAPQRMLSLVIGGQQPYRWPDSLLTRLVTDGLIDAQMQGMEAIIQAMEAFWKIRFPEALRARFLDNDPAALKAAWTRGLAEGAVAQGLPTWSDLYGSRRYRLPGACAARGHRDTDCRVHFARRTRPHRFPHGPGGSGNRGCSPHVAC